MATRTADYLIQRLREWGVERIFGYPGDGINTVYGALGRANREGLGPEFVLARHEEMSAFEATGYAKFGHRPGVVLATSGPGAIHTLNGLYDAKMDHVPIVAIVGQQNRMSLGANYQQEVDLTTLFKDVSAYVQLVTVPEQLPTVVDRAMRIAQADRSVSTIIFPNDVGEEEWEPPPHAHGAVPGGLGYTEPEVVPPEAEVERAAEVLNAGSKVAMLVGQGARGAREEVEELAEILGAGVAKALLGKDVLSDDLPFVTGSIGLLGTKPSWDLMMEADTLLMVGSSLPYSEFLPKPGSARGIQIDLDARLIGIRYPMEVNLVGHAKPTLRRLIPLVKPKDDRSWRHSVEQGIHEWRELIAERAMQDAKPLNPQRVFSELSPRLPEDAMITSDSGSAANWYARYLDFRGEMRGSLSGNLATMGCGVPYAIGAKFAYPDRPAFALVGDGAFQMNGMNEMITVAQYWRRWEDSRLVVLVLHNNDLNQVTWEQRAFEGDPKFEASQNIIDFPYARFAEMIGLRGIKVDRPDAVAAAWDEALSADHPVVVEAVTDPDVPPLPAHVSTDQAVKLLQAVLRGDTDVRGILTQGFKGKIREFLPRR